MIIKDMVEALNNSKIALTLEELKEKISYESVSDSAIEGAICQSEEIKHKNIGEVIKEFNLKKYSYGVKPTMRVFYLNEEQINNFSKKSPYYS